MWRLFQLDAAPATPGVAESHAAVEHVLEGWRRRWFDTFTVVSIVGHIPILAAFLLGRSASVTPLSAGGASLAFLLLAAAAILRQADLRIRVLLFGCAAYLTAFIGALFVPMGAYAHAAPIAIPVLMMAFGGRPMWRIATLASVLLVIGLPLFRGPEILRPTPIKSPWTPAASLLVMLATQVVVLGRYHLFLSSTLSSEMRATAKLEREMKARRQLESEVAGIADRERQRFGHELHDGVCQQIAGALLCCHALELRAQSGEAVTSQELGALSSLLGDTLDETRRIAVGMCPLAFGPGALAAGIEELTNRAGAFSPARCEFRVSGNVEIPDPEAAQHLYRIAQEAIGNAVRHARAGRIFVQLCDCADDLLLVVEDDGVGLPAEIPTGGMGLRTMTSRARVLNGTLTLERVSAGGLRVSCRVPRDGAAWASEGPGGSSRRTA